MIVVTNSAAQTVQPGEDVVFSQVSQRCGCDTFFQGAGPLHIKCGEYQIAFTANVGGAAGTQANLAVTVDGAVVPESLMVATVAANADVHNVHCLIVRRNCIPGSVVGVRNTGTTPVTVQAYPALAVERI